MKRSLLFAIVVLLIAALFVSCNANKVEEDQLGNVSISGLPRTLDVTGEADVDVENLYWYYSATKADLSIFVTGKTEWKAVKNGKGLSGTSLGSFSSGAWTFCFYGFASEQSSKPSSPTEAAVYYQLGVEVAVEKNKQTNVVLELTPGALPDPVFAVNAVTWQYGEAPGIALALKIYADTATTTATTPEMTLEATTNDAGLATFSTSTGEYAPFTLESGEYSLRFEVVYTNGTFVQIVGETTPVPVIAEKGMSYTIVNHGTGIGIETTEEQGTVYIDGTKATGTKAKTVVSDEVTSFEVDVTPATATQPTSAIKTTVSFPENTLVADSTYSLTTEVYPLETTAASSAFVVSSDTPTAAAAIDLTLIKDNTSIVHVFDTAVTVTTYIAKGLTSVNVVYNDGSDTGDTTDINAGGTETGKEYVAAILTDAEQALGYLGYNPNTGYLSFTTTHFSVYAVGAEQNVYNKTTNTAYILREDGKLYSKSGEDYILYEPALTDELVLLDESKANMVDDSIDAFNAGFKWTAIHSAAPTTDFAGGYGTKIEPLLIETGSQWKKLISNESEGGLSGIYIRLISDIDMSGNSIAGYVCHVTNVGLDGQNHKIANLDSGLFGRWNYYYGKSIIKNVKIDASASQYSLFGYGPYDSSANIVFDNDVIKDSTANGGAFLYYTNKASVSFNNCEVENTVILGGSNMAVGGYVGNGQGITISNCEFDGTIVSTSEHAAGFVGQGKAVIMNSAVSSNTIIRNLKESGSVSAFDGQGGGAREGDNNTFAGTLSCYNEKKAHAQGSEAKWVKFDGIKNSDFTLDEEGNIKFVGSSLSFSKITISESIFEKSIYDPSLELTGQILAGGYSCYWEDLIVVDNINPDLLCTVDRVKHLVNYVSEDFVTKVACSTSIDPEVEWTKYDSYLDRETGTLYYNGTTTRENTCYFLGDAGKLNGTALEAKFPCTGTIRIVINAYDNYDVLLGSAVINYTVTFAESPN